MGQQQLPQNPHCGIQGKIESYLDKNFIVFKTYSEFGKLFNRFLEGILMAYAMNERQDSRLRKFDDYLLLRILYYADTDKLFKYLKRYDIKELQYEPSNPERELTSAIILEFWKQLKDLTELASDNLEQKGYYFWNKFERMISNSLTLLAITNFKPGVYEEFGDLLLKALTIPVIIRRIKPIYIANVIRDKGRFFYRIGGERDVNLSNKNPKLSWPRNGRRICKT